MKIILVSGSHRKNGQTLKVAKYCAARLEKLNAEAHVIDLSSGALPMWDESLWEKNWDQNPKWANTWKPIADQLRAADAVVVLTPEYAGMASAAIKNFFLFTGGDLLAHKPGLIISVSSGMGGTYPVAELRASSFKNCRLVYTPDHVIVRHVESVLNDTGDFKFAGRPAEGITADDLTRSRVEYSLKMLLEYAAALRAVRSSSTVNLKDFANGL